MSSKKGDLVVSFLTTLIIALIIFVPACYMADKIFRSSTQAKDNFVDFSRDIEDLYINGRNGERRTVLLIMDEITTLAYFEPGTEEVLVTIDAENKVSDYNAHFPKPSQCNDAQNCLCLFRKVETDRSETSYEIAVTPTRVLCNNFNYTLELETCSLGEPVDVNNYRCSFGFIIERDLIKEEIDNYYENPRRRDFQLIKQDSVIRITG
ncbi:MAG TPA: hypothetical protein VJG49_00635 [Candidatus Nanoarchaeia archaeon]|nr:hypothetical protein [Candidatus Nanoarchaeia archaeon]